MAIAPPVAEAEVVRAAQAGDRQAFHALYESYLPRIFDYALGMLRNRADAEDVASETFLRAVEKLSELRDPDAFKGWLYAIARNCALRIVEARKRAVPVDEHDEAAAPLDDSVLPVPDERAAYEEMRELFDQAASTLGEKERSVYELVVRHGLSSAEIARVLGVRPAYAYILVNRLKASVTEAAESVALARVGTSACAELAQVVAGTDPVSSRGRKAVARHARTCEICAETKRRRASLPVMMQGVAYAEPGQHFRRTLERQIDAKWSTFAGSGAATAGIAAVVATIAAVFVVSVALIAGAAQRTIVPSEPLPAVLQDARTTPAPTATAVAPVDDGTSGGPAPAPSGGENPQVVVVNGGSTGVETGTTSSGNSSSTGTTEPQATQPPRTEPGHQQPPVG